MHNTRQVVYIELGFQSGRIKFWFMWQPILSFFFFWKLSDNSISYINFKLWDFIKDISLSLTGLFIVMNWGQIFHFNFHGQSQESLFEFFWFVFWWSSKSLCQIEIISYLGLFEGHYICWKNFDCGEYNILHKLSS